MPAPGFPGKMVLLRRQARDNMQTESFFAWLGGLLGGLIRAIVDGVRFVLGGFGDAVGDFLGGIAAAMGMSPSVFNFAWLLFGLLLLYACARAFMRRAIFAGIIWLLLAVLVPGGLAG